MSLLSQYTAAEALERYLGNPMNPDNLFSFKNIIELDESESYPDPIITLLNQQNIHYYYIPVNYGGKLKSFEEFLAIARVIARRDLTVALAHGVTYLGALPIWIGGNEQQKQRLAEIIKNEAQVSFCLTERNHGSDILANETSATKIETGYLLSGEKWLIGNATRSGCLSVFTRTSSQGGPRGFSFFMVEKNNLDSKSYTHLPKIKTLGLRGANISGINFDNSILPKESLIGTVGSGLELVLKTLQITRSIHGGAALSLGQADTALRVVLNFVLSRQIYGGTVWQIPQAKDILLTAFLDILVCECVSIATARAIHVIPAQMSLLSAICKSFVPTTIDNVNQSLSKVLGARYYLREEHCWGIFQKIIRDNAIISIFDGNTAVNLQAIALQLPQIANYYQQQNSPNLDETNFIVQNIFNLAKPLPEFQPEKLDLYNRGQNDILQNLEMAIEYFNSIKLNLNLAPQVLTKIIELTKKIVIKRDNFNQSLLDLETNYMLKYSKYSEAFNIAQEYCRLHAASSCFHLWLYNLPNLESFFSQGEWLVMVLTKLLNNSINLTYYSAYAENLAQTLEYKYNNNQLFSIIPLQLG